MDEKNSVVLHVIYQITYLNQVWLHKEQTNQHGAEIVNCSMEIKLQLDCCTELQFNMFHK